MSFGHRLNAEDVFFRLADQHFAVAECQAGLIQDTDLKGSPTPFIGYPTNDGLASATIAIVAWAVSLEAFVNLAWKQTISKNLPSSESDELLRKRSTVAKARELLQTNGRSVEENPWWPEIDALVKLRNRLVHYKDDVSYQGFESAPPFERELSQRNCRQLREAVRKAIRLIGDDCDLRTDFIDGQYEIVQVFS